MQIKIKQGGLLGDNTVYHGRQGACRKAGLKHLRHLIDATTDPLLRLEYEGEHARTEHEAAASKAATRRRRLGLPDSVRQA